jgi:hypothetical protein
MADYLEIARQVAARRNLAPRPAPPPASQADPHGLEETTPGVRTTSPAATQVGQGPDSAEVGQTWAEWKAAALNRLFREQGTSGQPGRITAATVRHGEQKAGWKG